MYLPEMVALACLAAGIVIVRRYHGLFNLFDPVSYFFFAHIVLFYIGIFYRNLYEDVVPIADSSVIWISVGLLLFTLGVVQGNLIGHTRRPNKHNASSLARPIKLVAFAPGYQQAAWVLFMLGALGVFFFIWKTGTILWLEEESDDLRVSSREGIGWIAILSISFVTYATVALVSFAIFRQAKPKFAFLVALVAALLVLQFGNRAPAAEILVYVGFIYCLYRWGRVPATVAISGTIAIFVLVATLGIIRQGLGLDAMMIGLQMLWRPFVNIQNIDIVFHSFPHVVPFQFGLGLIQDLSVVLPGYQPNFGTWVKNMLGMEFTGGSLTITYQGELYANFGFPGLIFGAWSLGMALSLGSLYLRKHVVPQNFAYLAAVAIPMKSIVTVGVVSPILYGLIPMLLAHGVFILARETLAFYSRAQTAVADNNNE